MGTRWLLLWLEAPLQSWGADSKFSRRDTLEFPTKSGVLGLVLCAMGASGEQIELLARFSNLNQTVLSFQYSKEFFYLKAPLLHDFQMVGAGYDLNNQWQKNFIPKKADGAPASGNKPGENGIKLTHRYYLQNAIFAVLLEVPADLTETIANALQNPVYPIYLGRRCCVPTDFVYHGEFASENEAEQAAKDYAAKKSELRNENLPDYAKKSLSLNFKVIDGDFSEKGDVFTLNDVPIQFGTQKMYRDRRVTKISEGLS